MDYTTSEIAKVCGKSLRSVCVWAQKNNVKREGRIWVFDDEARAAILDYYGITPDDEPNEPADEPNEAKEEPNEADEPISEPNEPADESDELPDEPNEAANESNEPVADFGNSLNLIIESYEKQLAAKDETINNLLNALRESNETVKQLTVGYAAEKTADSVERMNAIELAPREEKKMGLTARLKFLFTGEK